MRTVPFKGVLWGVALRMGLQPNANLDANVAQAICEQINNELQEAWEHQPWPEWTIIERRYFRQWWDEGTQYEPCDERYDWTDGNYYRCVVASNGVAPSESNSWERIGPWAGSWRGGRQNCEPPADCEYEDCGGEHEKRRQMDPYVSLDQLDQLGRPLTPIGTVLKVTAEDPRKHPKTRQYDVWFGPNGIQIPPDTGRTVWIQFRLRPPVFTSCQWSGSTAYVANDLVYDPVSGNCYIALLASTNQAVSNSTYWQAIPFPYVLAKVVKEKVWATMAADDGNVASAARSAAIGEQKLSDEWDKVEGQQGQERFFTVHVRQSRGVGRCAVNGRL
jgi:hypothetical protein